MLLDSPFKEIHALKLAADGTIYAAAFSGAPGGEDRSAPSVIVTPPDAAPRAPVPTVSAEITGITVVDATSGVSAGGVDRRPRAPRNAEGGDLSASARTACGTRCGKRPTTGPSTS